ncbi:MAG: hypothetical protein RLZZ292_2476 [Bacteroidota bacterium]|jgi:hypothetical protein
MTKKLEKNLKFNLKNKKGDPSVKTHFFAILLRGLVYMPIFAFYLNNRDYRNIFIHTTTTTTTTTTTWNFTIKSKKP